VFADAAALRADRAVGPEFRFHEVIGSLFVVEVFGGEDGHGVLLVDSVCTIIYIVFCLVNRTAYMTFNKATDALFDRVTHEDLAKELGASVPSIRQARLGDEAHGHRTPPEGWERAVRVLAEGRIKHFQRLLGQLGN